MNSHRSRRAGPFDFRDASGIALILTTFIITMFILGALLGCNHDTPIGPAVSQETATVAQTGGMQADSAQIDRMPVGWWHVTVDPVALSVDAEPIRSASAHWNVTGLMRSPTCPGCLAFNGAHLVEPGLMSVTAQLSSPFAGKPELDAFDVRGIVYGKSVMTFPAGSVSGLVQDPDGYCARWSTDPWARINPYVDFATDEPDRRFAAGSTHQRECLIRLPAGGPLTFDFAIDACWLPPKMVDPSNPSLSQHCNEAWDVECDVSGPINGNPGAFALLTADFRDWQGDGGNAKVTVEVSALATEPVQFEWNGKDDPAGFMGIVANELHAAAGNYPALVCVRDALDNSANDALATFALTYITVTDSTPQPVGLAVYPGTASLEDKGSEAQFDAVARYGDGGLSSIQSGVEWSVTGTDLNGATLAEIDSAGVARRLTSRWWGGTATVRASWQSLKAEATAFCTDPFADSADVDFGAFCEPGGTYTKVQSLLGPPKGAGMLAGGTDVCALGYGGVATLEFVNNIIVDGPGPDFIVFENAFYAGDCDWNGETQHVSWCETAIVEVSRDGKHWVRFPPDYNPTNIKCGIDAWANPDSFTNLAGVHPVLASVAPDGTLAGGIDPTDPIAAGGDSFDLSQVGLDWCRYVRLIDTGDGADAPGTEQYDQNGDMILDFGKMSPLGAQPGLAGFDCDSVAAIHSASPLTINK